MPLMPERDPEVASLRRELNSLKRNMDALWKRRNDYLAPSHPPTEIIYSYPGTPEPMQESPAYAVRLFEGYITQVDIHATSGNWSNADWTLQILVNAEVKQEVIWAQGAEPVTVDGFFLPVEERDRVSVRFEGTPVNDGTPPFGITVQMQLETRAPSGVQQ